jgi:hypothetical protein
MTFPVFASGDVLNASDMNGVGLWLVKSQAVGSGVASVTVTGAFSADYENYLVTLSGGTMSSSTAITIQLSGITSGYYGTLIYANYATLGITAAADNNSSVFTYFGGGDTNGCGGKMLLLAPNKSIPTRVEAGPMHYGNFFGTYVGAVGGTATGFVISAFTGTLTGGTIRVYGYRN